MIFPTSVHRNRLLFSIFALLLAVFLWGLQYKMSLYHGAEQSRSAAPPAKLLSEAEYPSSLRAVVSFLSKSRLKVTVVPAVPSVFHAALAHREHNAPLDVQDVLSPACAFSQFLPRPPPLS